MGLLSSREDICCQDGNTLLSVSHTSTEGKKYNFMMSQRRDPRCFAPAACLVGTRVVSCVDPHPPKWLCWVTSSLTTCLDSRDLSVTAQTSVVFCLYWLGFQILNCNRTVESIFFCVQFRVSMTIWQIITPSSWNIVQQLKNKMLTIRHKTVSAFRDLFNSLCWNNTCYYRSLLYRQNSDNEACPF